MKTEMLTRKSDVDSAGESTWNMSYHISYDIHLIFIWYSFISKQILLLSSSFVIIYLIRFINTEIPYLGVSITLGSLDNTKKARDHQTDKNVKRIY